MVHSIETKRDEAVERKAGPASLPWYVRLLANQSSLGFNAGDTNLYRYVANNPETHTDPMGLELPSPNYPIAPRPAPPRPPGPPFPGPGKKDPPVENPKYNVPVLNTWCICPTSKKDRLKPIPGVETTPKVPPVGPPGGSHQFYGLPAPDQMVGAGGCQGCIAAVVKCDDGVGVFHFSVGDMPLTTLLQYTWGKNCTAVVCGGDDTHMSNCLADRTLKGLGVVGITVVGVSGGSGCGVKGDGGWYDYK